MANVRGGVFTLRTLSRLKKDENWFALSDVWIAPSPFIAAPPNTGYFGPISSPSGLRTDKVTFTSDTTAAVPGANLPGRYSLAATGSSAAGYFGGGDSPSPSKISTMDKITYSTDSSSSVPGGSLSDGRRTLAATGNSTNGYFGGGEGAPTAPALRQSRMDKVTYSSETTAQVPGARLSVARDRLAATGNSTAGYFGGGEGPATRSTMDKITYSTDTTAAVPGASLSSGRASHAATGNSTAGYFGGGRTTGASSSRTNLMDKVTYSTDTTAAVPGANLSAARYNLAATGNSTAGYFGGGVTPAPVTTMDKVTYSTDTRTTVPGANLTGVPGASSHAASSALANALPSAPFVNPAPSSPSVRYSDSLATPPNTGYYASGSAPGGNVLSMDKVNYSTDTSLSVAGAVLSLAQFGYGATGNSTAGYFGGGRAAAPGTPIFTTMDKLTYSSDTRATVPGASLSAARYGVAATGNSTAGYFGGGYPGPRSTMDKVTYSSDTRTTVPGAFLSIPARYYLAATGNQTAGYFGGGSIPGASNTQRMDKITYSTDTRTSLPATGQLSAAGQLNNATGNSTAGYFGGVGGNPGAGGKTTIDKITYSTDTRSTVPAAGSFLVARFAHGATGNSTAGYFGGGYLNINNVLSSVEKIDYATDTRALSFFLSNNARAQLAASGARANGVTITEPPAATPTSSTFPVPAAPTTVSDAGYFGGGAAGALVFSTMDKVTYSSDTRTTVPGASLSAARQLLAATGSSTAGYFGGGAVPGTGARSTMDKVTYSSDTTAQVPGASLSVARQDVAATGNTTAGYFGGGRVPTRSTMDKVTYSSDTTAQVPGASLSTARYGAGATGNSTAGYFGGGRNSTPIFTTMDKLTYSTDTTAVVPGAALITNRLGLGAAGNATAGYFGGGAGGSPVQNRSLMDKVTYSSDTTAAVPGANLSAPRNFVAATGNSSNGYFAGGSPSSSTMDKIDYATDTRLSAIPGASLSAARYGMGASSALANALPSAPIPSPPVPTPNIV